MIGAEEARAFPRDTSPSKCQRLSHFIRTISHKRTTAMKPPKKPQPDTFSIARRETPSIVLLVGVLSLVSYVSQVILAPVYGGVGTGLRHYNVVLFISTATSLATFIGVNLPQRHWRGMALVLMSAPLLLPTLFRYSPALGPISGPILTQAIMTWPCVFLVSHELAKNAAQMIGNTEIRRSLSLPSFLALSIGISLTVVLNITERLLTKYFQPLNGVLWSRFSMLLFLGVFALVMDTAPSSLSSAEWVNFLVVFLGVVPYILIVLNRPHVVMGVSPALLARLPKEYMYLDRRESITGMLTVVENSVAGYRVLKCDHSLLGGLWVGLKRDELMDKGIKDEELERRSTNEAESVYTAFLVQEGVRLVNRPRIPENALIMYCHF